ncbi:MAG TPA: DUF4080 domain-containing protein [Verrucomicrobiae bacterium]|nr:DUF4080 domain-containing protein [Verrucomicrobiae bacterium]
MADIVLTTLNAKYIHASFGLRYLMANLGQLQSHAAIAEFDINQRPLEIAEQLLALNPRILGFGIYIWNVTETEKVIATIKRVRPEIVVILGGPEVSHETGTQSIVHLADHVITGEADLKFAELCNQLLLASLSPLACDARSGRAAGTEGASSPQPSPPLRAEERELTGDLLNHGPEPRCSTWLPKIVHAPLPDFSQLALPYDLYNADDIAHRIIYIEASRGCPFTCEFCLSSLDVPVRQVPLPLLLDHLQRLIDRGVKQFKFVDRTFNLNVNVSQAILEFFLARHQPGHFYHFEMIPDRLPVPLREIIAKFPAGSLQFEVGIQTFNPTVGGLIKRRQNYDRLEDNFRFLRQHTGVHLHADLIAGLPGETLESFASGFNRLIALQPHEIQVGILKRLRGTPIVRHDAEWRMVYSSHPPYEILQNKLIDFATMQRLRRFAKYWDLVGNSGNFVETTPLLWAGDKSPFGEFQRLSEWLYARTRRTDSIALMRLMELLFVFLTREREDRIDPKAAAEALWRDYQRGGRFDKPGFLKDYLPEDSKPARASQPQQLPKRQSRHAAA